MAIKDVGQTTVGKLLEEPLQIPPYQRPYSWRPETALQLLNDIREAARQKKDVPYVLGAVILHSDTGEINVVEGQQRLLTLCMLLDLLAHPDSPTDAAPSKNTQPIVLVRRALQREIGRQRKTGQLDGETQNDANGSSNNASDKEGLIENQSLAEFIKEKCHLIRIETDDIDEAFRVFDSQNYRGKPLAPHDLLKAHHLRIMCNESSAMKRALVDAWESAGDAALDRLFSRYLYRIARWSRGESAQQFTAQDIGLFKGITPGQDTTPHAHYHSAAQAAMPLLTLLDSKVSDERSRSIGHARFQLEAPLVAGRLFFERITFMLDELKRLAAVAFADRYAAFSLYRISETDGAMGLNELPACSRYRYVSELYLSVVLYYTNKFGEEKFERVRDVLFAWAYTLRTNLLRVQYRSVDNLARDNNPEVSIFKRIRNSTFADELLSIPISISLHKDRPKHENELVAFLKCKGFYTNEPSG